VSGNDNLNVLTPLYADLRGHIDSNQERCAALFEKLSAEMRSLRMEVHELKNRTIGLESAAGEFTQGISALQKKADVMQNSIVAFGAAKAAPQSSFRSAHAGLDAPDLGASKSGPHFSGAVPTATTAPMEPLIHSRPTPTSFGVTETPPIYVRSSGQQATQPPQYSQAPFRTGRLI